MVVVKTVCLKKIHGAMKLFKNIILVSVLGFLFMACTSESRKEYALSTEEALSAYLQKEDILAVEKVANILL